MNISEDVTLIDIKSKEELLGYYSGISALFEESFSRKLDRQLWEWAYIDNPFGEPLVSIALCDERVIGHYAVIPMNLESQGASISGFLSMTTMVAVDFRRFRLFQRLAEMVYTRIEKANVPSIVFGFPNDNSAPGFIKRLSWTVSEQYKVVSVKPDQINRVSEILKRKLDEDCFTLNMNCSEVKNWRTNKPNQIWSYDGNIGLKSINNDYDLMHISDVEQLRAFEYSGALNLILPIEDTSELLDEIEVSFPYRFGYRVFNSESEPNLFVQMSMSDIF